MRKILVLGLVPLFALTACREEPAGGLPEFTGPKAVLNAANSTLTKDDSSEVKHVSLEIPDSSEVYEVEIGTPCYLKETSGHFFEIIVKPGAYIKSVSTVTVDRLIVDIYGGKGINFEVYNNVEGTGEQVKEYSSTIPPTEPGDGGLVLQYPINSTGWIIKNTSSFKPAFYSISVCLG